MFWLWPKALQGSGLFQNTSMGDNRNIDAEVRI